MNPHFVSVMKDITLESPSFGDLSFDFHDGPNGWVRVRNSGLLPEIATGRKFPISDHATRSEIAQTALMALLAWLEHEAREAFCYRGKAIFGPHFDIDALACLVDNKMFDVRPPVSYI